MTQDDPDTVAMEETSQWEHTQVEDVFLPSVRVQLAWKDIETAVAGGAVVPAQAHVLWAAWAAPGSATRVAGGASPLPARPFVSTQPDALPADAALPASGSPWAGRLLWLLAGAVLGAGALALLKG